MTRREGALAAAVVGAVAGYAALRLGSAAAGEVDPRAVVASEHIAFYWRCATAAWWGALAALTAWRWPVTGAWAARALVPTVIAATLAAALVP